MELFRQARHAAEYWRTEGPFWVARVAGTKVLNRLCPLLPPMTNKSLHMLLRLGYWPDIRNPRTFNEKVAHRQLISPHPLAPLLADKWRVRDYVAERGLAHILNEIYFVTDEPDTIPFDELPDRFVVKANHGSGWNILVRNKATLDRRRTVRQCRKWLGQRYSRAAYGLELHYDSIKPLVLVEKLLEDRKCGFLRDYKFYCFHGRVHHVYVFSPEPAGRKLNVYDPDWNEQNYTYLPRGAPLPRPPALAEMLNAAERLSRDLDFCRIDCYYPDEEKLVFGEVTMNPQGACRKFRNRAMDLAYGQLW